MYCVIELAFYLGSKKILSEKEQYFCNKIRQNTDELITPHSAPNGFTPHRFLLRTVNNFTISCSGNFVALTVKID
jgi:hypothetical protein